MRQFLTLFFSLLLIAGLFGVALRPVGGGAGKIAFLSAGNIYLMNIDGSDLTRLTDIGVVGCFTWSPDGQKIAFSSNYDIYVINAVGRDQPRLIVDVTPAHGDAAYVCPTWSTDSQQLFLAVPFLDGIYVAQADGSSLTRLADLEGWDYAWSPDRQTVAFVSERDGGYEIYVMKTDPQKAGAGGSNPTRLTDNTARDLDPAWSPDGQTIAFASDREVEDKHELYLMQADTQKAGTGGSNPRQLTQTSSRRIFRPTWSPDGQMIVYTRSSEDGVWIDLIRADGTGYKQLVQGRDLQGRDPVWSPDGRYIAFRDDSDGISLMDIQSQNVTKLPIPPTLSGYAPAWQPYTTPPGLAHDDVTTTPVTSTPSFRVEPFTPRLIDAESERIYTIGYVDGLDKAQTLVLNLADERPLTNYDLAGGLALDTVHDRLYIDQYRNTGLAVLDTLTGQLERTILLPGEVFYSSPLPQADPATGRVLAFRDNLVYIADPENGTIIDTITFEVRDYLQEIAPIERPLFDPVTRLLYLTFTVHGCTSSISGDCSTRKLVVYDLAAGHEITCDDSRVETGMGYYVYCTGNGWVPVWGESRPWFDPVSGGDQESRVDFDPTRQLFYEVTPTQLKVYDAARLTLTLALSRPVTGAFERYEVKTDALQFRLSGQLQNWPASAIQPPAPEPLFISPLPTTPVQTLAVSPGWPADPTLLGAWLDPTSSGDYNRLFTCNSLFYISRDGGRTWGQSRGGLAGGCGLHWPSLAVSPDFVHDQTLFAGVRDMGILTSSDGGQLWRPSGVSLPDRFTRKILLSPDFAADKTVVAIGSYHSYRSNDGGSTWQILHSPASAQPGQWQDLALSAEFEQDHTILGSVYDNQTQRARLFISKDGGDQWAAAGEMPQDATTLSLAPLFATWQTVFAYGPNHLYRSADGGQHWEPVLTIQDGWLKQLVYGPNIEQNRPIFVLSALTDQTMSRSVESNRLYRSNDGGQTWQPFDLPTGVIPTTLAISSHFDRDRTLFIGTAEGQVLTVEVMQ